MTLEFLAAEKIAEVAFGAAVEFGVGKLAEGAIAKVNALREKIKGKLQGNPEAESAIATVENSANKNSPNVDVIVPHLKEAMKNDPEFEQQLNLLAREIIIDQRQQENNTISTGDISQTGDKSAVNTGQNVTSNQADKMIKIDRVENLSID